MSNINEQILISIKKWIEVNKPDDRHFLTQTGALTVDQIMKQIEEKTVWGLDFAMVVKLKYLGYVARHSLSTEEEKERIIYTFVAESMKNLQTLSVQ
ncbi:MAG: hypothetical protein WCT08_01610 [Patescibacteria group bacterium]|jgi:hypothetical protein